MFSKDSLTGTLRFSRRGMKTALRAGGLLFLLVHFTRTISREQNRDKVVF
jgi:hypothetical protein